jgi:hypothetical protein
MTCDAICCTQDGPKIAFVTFVTGGVPSAALRNSSSSCYGTTIRTAPSVWELSGLLLNVCRRNANSQQLTAA